MDSRKRRTGTKSRPKPKGRKPKAEPFPMETFKQLLRQYCRENFSEEVIEENANGADPYIGVCVGDSSGSQNHPIIQCGVFQALWEEEAAR